MWDQYGNWLPVEAAQADWTGGGYPGMPGYGGDPRRQPGYGKYPHHGKFPWFKYFFPRRRRRHRRYHKRDMYDGSGY